MWQRKDDSGLFKIPEELERDVRNFAEPELLPAISIHEKLARAAAIEEINSKTREHFSKLFEENPQFTLDEIEQNKKYVDLILEHILAEEVRRLITNDKIRPDGRAVTKLDLCHQELIFLKERMVLPYLQEGKRKVYRWLL